MSPPDLGSVVPRSRYTASPQKEMMAPRIHTIKVPPTEPTFEYMDEGTEKMPTPIVFPRMILIDENVPNFVRSLCVSFLSRLGDTMGVANGLLGRKAVCSVGELGSPSHLGDVEACFGGTGGN